MIHTRRWDVRIEPRPSGWRWGWRSWGALRWGFDAGPLLVRYWRCSGPW